MTAYTVTFYSFKGGSGRTTLLLNVAHALLEKSERVLIWDLDVEAPGVHLFPGCSPREAWPSGFLEWLRDTGVAQGQAPDDDALDALMARVYPVPRPADQDGQLLILPAHAIGAQLGSFDLAALHGELGWNELFVRHPARVLDTLGAIRDRLIERFAPTFLLIDSRTGITDLGGLLTAVIPDCTVLVGNYGAQSTDGLLAVYDALDAVATERWQKTPERRRKLDRLLVASPVPSLTRTELEERRALWRERFAVPPRNFIEIPLIENLLYGEAITVQSAAHTDAAQRYREVAQALRRTRDGWTLERKPYEPQALPKGARELDVDPHRQLVTRAQRLFSLLGYELGASNADADFVARERSVLQPRAYDVRCVPGELGLDRVPTARPTTAGVPLLVGHSARDEVRAAADAVGVLVRTVGDLERQLIDLGAYAAAIRRNFESSELARSYVRQRFRRAVAELAVPDDDEVLTETLDEDDGGSVPEATSDALAHAMRWATGEGSQLWLVLGDYGTGKTSFFRRLAYELATRAETDPSIPIPIAIDLRQLSLAASLEALLQQHLRTTIGWHGNPEAVLYLLQTGRIVLLFDAFDEMAAASYGIGVDDQLRMLAGPALARAEVRAANRVLITCRKNFFRDERQIDRVVGSASRRTEVSYVGGLPSRGSAHTSELDLFNPAQVRAFLEYRLGAERAAATLSVINRTYGLRSLAPRPLLLEMIAHSVAGLAERGDRITIGLLYEQYARDWLEHASDASQTTPVQRERLLEHLAARLWQLPDNEIHYDQLADFVAATEPMLLGGLDPQRVDLELRSAAFLIRSPSGHYRFSHKSFLEYFLAREVIRRAADGWEAGRDALTTEQLTAPCAGFVRDLADDRAEARAALLGAIGEILRRPYTRRASENAAWLALAFTRDEATGDDAAASPSLTRLASRKGAAAAPLGEPLLRGARLEGANLEGWVQVGARFTGAILTGANLARARLLSCDLSGCRLDGANLRGVRLWHSNLDRADLRGASLRGADLDQVRLDGADLSGADLSTSIARRHLRAAGAKLDDANLRGTQWRDPRLGGATWAGAAARHAHWRTATAIDVQPARLRAARPAFIRGVGIDPDRRYLALAEGGDVITIRDLDGSGPLAMRRVDYVVTCLAIAADRSVLAAGGVGGAVTLWSFPDLGASRTIATPLPGIVEVAIAPDRIVAVGPGGAIAAIDRTGPLDGVAREVVAGVDGAKVGAMTPDGRWVARDRADGRLEIIDVATAAVAWSVALADLAALAIRGGDQPALAVAGRDGVEVWQDRRALARIDAVAGTTIADVGWVGDRVAMLTNDALSGCSLRHWNPWTGDSTTTTATAPGAGLAIKAIAHDQIYASTSDGLVRFEDNATRALVSRTGVVGHAYLLDLRRILTGGSQGLLLWDAAAPSIIELRGLPAGRQAATAMSADRRLLALATDGLLHTLELAAVVAAPRAPVDLGGGVAMHGVERLAFSPDGRWLGGAGRRLAVTAVGRKLATHDGGADDLACIDVAFAGIEHPLVTAHRDAPVRIWRVDPSGEVRPGRSPWSGPAPHAAAIALTGDGRTLFAGDGDGRVTRHDLARGTAEPALVIAPRSIPIRALTLSPDGQRLAVASMGGELAIIEVAGGGVARCRGHEGAVLAVRWSGDGARLITASADGAARIWDADGLIELATLYPDSGAWIAGAYTAGALDDLVLTEGRRCASARLYIDLCVRPDLVQAAVAGRPAPALTIDFGHAERTLGPEDPSASEDPPAAAAD